MKHVIAKDGTRVSTLFSIVSFPAVDRKRFDHPFAFCLILSTMDANKSFFRSPNCSGSPRYFPTPPSLWIWSFSLMIVLKAYGVLAEKITEDLLAFIVWPEASSYYLSISPNASLLSLVALTKNIVSSAKRRWLMRGHPFATLMPSNMPCD